MHEYEPEERSLTAVLHTRQGGQSHQPVVKAVNDVFPLSYRQQLLTCLMITRGLPTFGDAGITSNFGSLVLLSCGENPRGLKSAAESPEDRAMTVSIHFVI